MKTPNGGHQIGPGDLIRLVAEPYNEMSTALHDADMSWITFSQAIRLDPVPEPITKTNLLDKWDNLRDAFNRETGLELSLEWFQWFLGSDIEVSQTVFRVDGVYALSPGARALLDKGISLPPLLED